MKKMLTYEEWRKKRPIYWQSPSLIWSAEDFWKGEMKCYEEYKKNLKKT